MLRSVVGDEFQSPQPMQAATGALESKADCLIFQSPQPMQAATSCAPSAITRLSDFNPRSLCRLRLSRLSCAAIISYFNPRSLCRLRLSAWTNLANSIEFQSPQPMQAATTPGNAGGYFMHNFNPRSLCRLRQLNIVALPNLLLHVANASLTLSLHRFRELGKHRSF